MSRTKRDRVSTAVLLVSVLGALGFPASGASAQSDVQLWTRIGVRHRVHRSIRLELDQHLRLDEQLSRIGSVMTEVSAAYDPARWLRFGVGYRFILEQGDNGFDTAHRIHVDARLRGVVGPLRVAYRVRFQEGLEDQLDGLDARHTIRNQLAVVWDTERAIEPEVSAEIYARAGGKRGLWLTKWRLTVGGSYELDRSEIDFFYRLEMPIDDPEEPVLHIFGLGYSYSL